MTPSAAPRLSADEIKERLEEVFAHRHGSHLVALFGVGEPSKVPTRVAGTFRVVPTAHEAELRRALPDLDDEDARIVFLVPWASQLPLDVQGRFAVGGRVLQVGKLLRMRRMFGLPDRDDAIDPAVLRSALADHLLRTGTSLALTTAGGRLTRAELWSTWLRVRLGVPTSEGLSLDLLLGWAARRPAEPVFPDLGADETRRLQGELVSELEARLGAAGPLVWDAWEKGRGARVLELAILGEGVRRAQDEGELREGDRVGLDVWSTTKIEHELGARVPVDAARRLLRELGEAAGGALRWIERTDGRLAASHHVAAAEARIDGAVRPWVSASPRLRTAWDARLDALGGALVAAAAAPSKATVDAAREARLRLEQHEHFTSQEGGILIERASMAVRLAAWLAARRDLGAATQETSWAPVGRLAGWYAEEGGYVDRARHHARGDATSAFGRGVQAVVEAADRARESLDHAFAAALPEWLRAGRPTQKALPIDHAAERFVAGFLRGRTQEEHSDRRLLVLLLDGMGWAQAVELLESLAALGSPWGVVGWTSTPAVAVGQGPFPPVLAAIPTLTETSRSAFFAGAPVEAGRTHNTGDDPNRWARNRAMRELLDPHDATPVKLRGEASTSDGSADGDVLARVRETGPDKRVVTVVLNAIDSALKADAQQRRRWTVDAVKALLPILEAAEDAGRFVLLASDHGHVTCDRLRTEATPRGVDGGRRWRALLDESEPLEPWEVAFPAGAGVWTPRGAKGVVLIADDAHRYGASTAAGEHGGTTLAEVVAPLVLLAPMIGHPAPSARELSAQGPPVPTFWQELVELPLAAAPARTAAPPRRRPSSPQLSLTLGGALDASVPAPAPVPNALTARGRRVQPLAGSPVFQAATTRFSAGKERNDDEVERLLDALELTLARDGRAPFGVLAEALRVPAFRLRSLAARWTEVMNVDGWGVLKLDGDTLHLDASMLEQVFEVRL
jgi:hypothetical protein